MVQYSPCGHFVGADLSPYQLPLAWEFSYWDREYTYVDAVLARSDRHAILSPATIRRNTNNDRQTYPTPAAVVSC